MENREIEETSQPRKILLFVLVIVLLLAGLFCSSTLTISNTDILMLIMGMVGLFFIIIGCIFLFVGGGV